MPADDSDGSTNTANSTLVRGKKNRFIYIELPATESRFRSIVLTRKNIKCSVRLGASTVVLYGKTVRAEQLLFYNRFKLLRSIKPTTACRV